MRRALRDDAAPDPGPILTASIDRNAHDTVEEAEALRDRAQAVAFRVRAVDDGNPFEVQSQIFPALSDLDERAERRAPDIISIFEMTAGN